MADRAAAQPAWVWRGLVGGAWFGGAWLAVMGLALIFTRLGFGDGHSKNHASLPLRAVFVAVCEDCPQGKDEYLGEKEV